MSKLRPLQTQDSPVVDQSGRLTRYEYWFDLDRLVRRLEADVSGTSVPITRLVTAGAGLTGGGALSADLTLNVGAGTGIQVNADSIEVLYGTTAGTAAQGNDARITSPALSSVTTAISGLLKGNGSGVVAAVAGTDYQGALTLTTTGTSGAATLVGNTLNIPDYNVSVTPAALTKTDDTNVTLTLGGTPGTALLQATSITVGWSGQLSIARGGTGASSASAARTALGLEIGTNVLAYDPDVQALAINSTNGFWARTDAGNGAARTLTGTSNRLTVTNGNGGLGNPVFDISTSYVGQATITTLGTITTGTWNGTTIAVANGGTGATSAANARTNLGLVIGTDVQAYDAELAAIAGLTSAANKVPYFTGSGTAALGDFQNAVAVITPVWGSTGTAPAIGNGTLTGGVQRMGGMMYVTINASFGSTTTFGTGTYQFSLPSPYNGNAVRDGLGVAFGYKDGVAFAVGAAVMFAGTNKIQMITHGSGNYWSNAVPYTWAVSTDSFRIGLWIPMA